MASLPYQLLLVCLLVFAPSTSGQSPPAFGRVIGDEMERVSLTDKSSVKLECPDKDGFIGVSDRNNSRFVSQSRMFRLEFSYRRGDFEDLKRVREQKLGPYHCLYRQGDTVNAYAFVISELPENDKITFREVTTAAGSSEITLTCVLSGDSGEGAEFVWEKYSDEFGTFSYKTAGKDLTLNYDVIKSNHFDGFTVYRCFDKKRPENMKYFGATFSVKMLVRPMRTTRYTSTLLPHYAGVDSALVLECEGAGLPAEADSPARIRRKYNSTAYTDIREVSDDNYIINDQIRSVNLRINKLMRGYEGIYICNRDNVIQMANVTIDYGSPKLAESGKRILKDENVVECHTEKDSAARYLYFTVKQPGMQSLTLFNGSNVGGFAVAYNGSRLVMQFASSPKMNGAIVECRLFEKKDIAEYSFPEYNLELSGITSTNYFIMTCKKNAEYGNKIFNFYRLHLNGTRELINPYENNIQQAKGFKIVEKGEYAEFVCETQVGDRIIRSNKVTHGIPPVDLNIVVNGEVNPDHKAVVAGRDVEILCQFSFLPSKKKPAAAGVSLKRNDARVELSPAAVNSTTFRFVLKEAGPEQSGNYTCVYAYTAIIRADATLTGNYVSKTTTLSICDSSQFVCDMKCMTRAALCNKTQECKDGADEAPENCDKCEPNEVKCQDYNGTAPTKRCVLKHWLCDTANDCGNNYDEDKKLHKKWCGAAPECNCTDGYTCCPRNNTICIRRDYECDKEPDCPGGADEQNCEKSTPCIRITEPAKPIIIEAKVGDPLNLTCVATGNDRPTVNWRRNWLAIPSGLDELNSVEGRDAAGIYTVRGNLVAPAVTMAMAGIYNCEAVNNCGRELSVEMELRVAE